MPRFDLIVSKAQHGKRIDIVIFEAELGFSRRRVRRIIDIGGVYLNRKRIRVASRVVTSGDKITVEYNEHALQTLKPKAFSLSDEQILFNQKNLVAINKPPGLPSQETKDQAIFHVIKCLQEYFKGKDETNHHTKRHLILVHRLDKETSGVLLIAGSAAQATWLTDQFKERSVKKRYLAVCYGVPKQPQGTIESYLSAIDKRTGLVRVVHSGGKQAITNYRVLKTNETLNISLIECYPQTGRSHQIRVHLDSIGCPIVGDKRYGVSQERKIPDDLRQLTAEHHFLHAASIRFKPLDSTEHLVLEATPPPNFVRFMELAHLN